MSVTKPYYTGPTKLVVAFDVGTTYSRISYCILTQGKPPEILGITKFPAQEEDDTKVPSLVYYDKVGTVRAAGAEVFSESVIEDALTDGWIMAEWWKLHLRPKHLASSINAKDDLPPLPPRKSAVDVLTDFIEYLYQCMKTYIQERHVALAWSTIEDSIEYIFTHPSGWEGFQQQQYRHAIEHAGLVPSTPEGRSRVHMLRDGEASLHYYVANLLGTETDNQSPSRGVVIIDCGGGTIDSSMYSITFNPTSCKEIAPAECLLQGSVFVTRRAKVLFQRKLEGWEDSAEEDINEFTREFDQITKLVIRDDRELAYVRVSGRHTNDSKYDIVSGKLRLSGDEATGLFADSIDAIMGAFEQQSKYTTTPITTVFIVGGLSINEWVSSRLQSYFTAKNITVCRPDNHFNKVVANGAVLSRIDRQKRLVASRAAQVTYGITCAKLVDENNEEHARRKHKWYTDAVGERLIQGLFEMKLRKGDPVREDMKFRTTFLRMHSDPAHFGMETARLVCYRGTLSDPKWVDQDPLAFSTHCKIRVDLSAGTKDVVMREVAGRVFYKLRWDVIVFYGLTELQAQLSWKSKEGQRQTVPATIVHEE